MLRLTKLNEEEIALIQAFRLLTSRQREMIMTGVIGTASNVVPRLATVVPLIPLPPRAEAAQK